jgi:hypothetical protein
MNTKERIKASQEAQQEADAKKRREKKQQENIAMLKKLGQVDTDTRIHQR